MDKFKQTQEKARRRTDRLLRGLDADFNEGTTRGFLDGPGGERTGRLSRASLRDIDDATKASLGRVGGGPGGRPLSMLGPHGHGGGGGSGLVKAGSGLTVPGSTGGGSGGSGTATDRIPPHRRGHSLAGGFGKFASGIARAGGSKDREKGKK